MRIDINKYIQNKFIVDIIIGLLQRAYIYPLIHMYVFPLVHTIFKTMHMSSSQCIEKLEIIGNGSFGRVFKW